MQGKGYACMLATYQLPRVQAGGWREGSDSQYKLAFLEFDEKSLDLKHGADGRPHQRDALFRALASPKQKYVITFVHGWRHDASISDNDVKRFRIFLAYARSFLNWRCQDADRYCNSEVIGIYVGWRGKALHEPQSEPWGTAVALPTFWSRKHQSEQHAAYVLKQIDDIQAALQLRAGDPTANKMMIIGHSFGGNLLATALKQRAISAVNSHEAGKLMPPILGDLTVLINPASEAHNWIDIQKALRSKVLDAQGRISRPKARNEFPRKQSPIYISLTATDNWWRDDAKGKPVLYDWPTGVAFQIGQSAALRLSDERRNALGHMLPTPEYPFGATHEVITNEGAKIKTLYRHAVSRKNSQCMIMDGWLRAARERESDEDWDSHFPANDKNKITHVSVVPRVNYQFRNQLYPEDRPRIRSDDPANSPFWNVRAYSNVITEHGGYVNYPMWCALNQMVLDDITASPKP